MNKTIFGALGETRTLTPFRYQNLNLGRLPIPPRAHIKSDEIKAEHQTPSSLFVSYIYLGTFTLCRLNVNKIRHLFNKGRVIHKTELAWLWIYLARHVLFIRKTEEVTSNQYIDGAGRIRTCVSHIYTHLFGRLSTLQYCLSQFRTWYSNGVLNCLLRSAA